MNRELLELMRTVENTIPRELRDLLKSPAFQAVRRFDAGTDSTFKDAQPIRAEAALPTVSIGVAATPKSGGKISGIEHPEERYARLLARANELGGTRKPGTKAKLAEEEGVTFGTLEDVLKRAKKWAKKGASASISIRGQISAAGKKSF